MTTTKAGNTLPQKQADATPTITPSARFTQMVMQEFNANAPGSQLTDAQKRLCQNYFIKLDMTLKAAEQKNAGLPEDRRATAITWPNINLEKLALDVCSFSKVGMDPLQPNHLNLIPYKNNATGKYDIGFILGYRGIELKAKRYAVETPLDVVVELVYSTDNFKQIKKDFNNDKDSYIFEVVNDFERGEIVGGFYYLQFEDSTKNRIRVFTKADIEKRKPQYASAEFWGGEKDEWVGGKKTGKKIKVDGWYEEMAYKTIHRAAYNSLTIDSSKIDDAYQAMLMTESEQKEDKIAQAIEEHANKIEIGFTAAEVVPTPTATAMGAQPEAMQPTEGDKRAMQDTPTQGAGSQTEVPF